MRQVPQLLIHALFAKQALCIAGYVCFVSCRVCVCVEALVVSCACFGIISSDHIFFVPSYMSVCTSGLSMSACHTAIRCGRSRGCCLIVYFDDLPCIILQVSDRRLDHVNETFQGHNGNNRATIPQRLVNKKWRGGKICKSVRNVNYLFRITPCTQYRKLAMTLYLI